MSTNNTNPRSHPPIGNEDLEITQALADEGLEISPNYDVNETRLDYPPTSNLTAPTLEEVKKTSLSI
jgi:hypothetical protein